MRLIQACLIAISMYSKIPVPRVEWKEKNMKYAMCFFPVVGVVTGICMYLAGTFLLRYTSCGPLFLGAALTLIPILISGGIHLDGLMDTADALSSYADREKKLAILKDSHAGAFAVLWMGCYLLWSTAVYSEVNVEMLPCLACVFVLSRALSGFSVVTFQAAKDSGLLKTFQDGAQRKTVGAVMILWILAAVCLLAWMDVQMCIAAAVCAGVTFVYYRHMSRVKFGGITGDLAGYFLSLCELLTATGIVLAGGGIWN
ncbi:adenosylcobinamide-GDP ribazoletransferase [Mediterraneibacter massiliensis]|uniref:adenosylcobinamide-GDP ribazoletransferase n=1 Tax=Mediterraneibacter massiliensis TaxID=1720300 RepID=UPI0024AE1556|nr:adenosylcobinamide-GDP ribazoletransferase [Mediterraneibacter massiliensis]